jgi:hypothetical protein
VGLGVLRALPRTANPVGEHDISAMKASLPRHCTYTSLRGPTQVPPPETLDCSSTVPPAGATPRFREGPSFRRTVDGSSLILPPLTLRGVRHSHHAEFEPSSGGAGCRETPAMVRRADDTY